MPIVPPVRLDYGVSTVPPVVPNHGAYYLSYLWAHTIMPTVPPVRPDYGVSTVPPVVPNHGAYYLSYLWAHTIIVPYITVEAA
jgi:hypothetical protein